MLLECTGPALLALGLGWGVGFKVIPEFAGLWVLPYVNVTSAEKNLKCILKMGVMPTLKATWKKATVCAAWTHLASV